MKRSEWVSVCTVGALLLSSITGCSMIVAEYDYNDFYQQKRDDEYEANFEVRHRVEGTLATYFIEGEAFYPAVGASDKKVEERQAYQPVRELLVEPVSGVCFGALLFTIGPLNKIIDPEFDFNLDSNLEVLTTLFNPTAPTDGFGREPSIEHVVKKKEGRQPLPKKHRLLLSRLPYTIFSGQNQKIISKSCAKSSSVDLWPLVRQALKNGAETFETQVVVGNPTDKVTGRRKWVFSHTVEDLIPTLPPKQTHGYVVGRVHLKLNGVNGIFSDLVGNTKVDVACFRDNELKILQTTTDKNGYFVLEDQPLDASYFSWKIRPEGFSESVPAYTLQNSDDNGVTTMLRFALRSWQQSPYPIIACGETVMEFDRDANLVVRKTCGGSKVTVDFSKEGEPFNIITGDFGYPSLSYFASSHNSLGEVKTIAKYALRDRANYAKAYLLIKEANKMNRSDPYAAQERYQAAINAYPFCEDAYVNLADLLLDRSDCDKAIPVLKEAHKIFPESEQINQRLHNFSF